MSSNHRPPTLLEYLIEQGFTPQSEGTWFDLDTGDSIIRVVHAPGEEAQLISLTPARACRYKVMFHVGTPDAVIIAAIDSAVSLANQASRPGPGGRRPAARARRES